MSTTKAKPAVIVTVHRPELTPEERAKRMEEIKKAAAALIKVQMQREARATA